MPRTRHISLGLRHAALCINQLITADATHCEGTLRRHHEYMPRAQNVCLVLQTLVLRAQLNKTCFNLLACAQYGGTIGGKSFTLFAAR